MDYLFICCIVAFALSVCIWTICYELGFTNTMKTVRSNGKKYLMALIVLLVPGALIFSVVLLGIVGFTAIRDKLGLDKSKDKHRIF